MKLIDLIGIIVLVGLAVGMLSFAVQTIEKDNEDKLIRYKECKERTADIEWCIKTIRPML